MHPDRRINKVILLREGNALFRRLKTGTDIDHIFNVMFRQGCNKCLPVRIKFCILIMRMCLKYLTMQFPLLTALASQKS